jgi:hypothetical protein
MLYLVVTRHISSGMKFTCANSRHRASKIVKQMPGRDKNDAGQHCHHVAVIIARLQARYGDFTERALSDRHVISAPSDEYFDVKTSLYVYKHSHESPILREVSKRHKEAAAERRKGYLPNPLYPGPRAADFHTNNRIDPWKRCICTPQPVLDLRVAPFSEGEYLQVTWAPSDDIARKYHLAVVIKRTPPTIQLVYSTVKEVSLSVTWFPVGDSGGVADGVYIVGELPTPNLTAGMPLLLYAKFGFASDLAFVTKRRKNVCVYSMVTAQTTNVGTLVCLNRRCELPCDGGYDHGLFRSSADVFISQGVLDVFNHARQLHRCVWCPTMTSYEPCV